MVDIMIYEMYLLMLTLRLHLEKCNYAQTSSIAVVSVDELAPMLSLSEKQVQHCQIYCW